MLIRQAHSGQNVLPVAPPPRICIPESANVISASLRSAGHAQWPDACAAALRIVVSNKLLYCMRMNVCDHAAHKEKSWHSFHHSKCIAHCDCTPCKDDSWLAWQRPPCRLGCWIRLPTFRRGMHLKLQPTSSWTSLIHSRRRPLHERYFDDHACMVSTLQQRLHCRQMEHTSREWIHSDSIDA